MHTVTIEKFVFGGQGLARLEDGRVVFVWNALPGEQVEIEILKKKKDYLEAVATKIITPSPYRVDPIDDHFLSTSPWQMIDWEKENEWKVDMATETYSKIADLILHANKPEIAFDPNEQYGYRNKMEFSFTELEDGTKSLAFFQRGKKKRIPITSPALASKEINETGQYILDWVNKHNIPMRSLKALIVRHAGEKSIAALFIKDRLPFDDFPELTDTLIGFQLYYSTHKSPASVPTELMYSAGQDYLIQDILGTKLKFGLLSFFQINPPLFEMALKDIAAFLDPKVPVIDFYAGVGAIGLPLSHSREQTILVESNQEAVAYAKENIDINNLNGCEARCIPAEKMTEIISEDKMVILDPPRAGLHHKVISALRAKKPQRIIYLSCNISTQARDMRLLSSEYKISFLKLYNFFPRTPHIEGLVVLDRI